MSVCKLSERECQDVAQLLQFAADRNDTPSQYSSLMKRGASLLIQLSNFCAMQAALDRNNKENGGQVK